MSVVFDEVVGTIAPEPAPREEPQRNQDAAEPDSGHVREEIQKLEQRMARLQAD
jgi:hypothetical protein